MNESMNERDIYFDYAAATPVDPRAFESYLVSTQAFANPSSIHSLGVQTKGLLADSREKVADVFSVRPQEIIFTSGATESNNIALQGIVKAAMNSGIKHPHVISSSIEHDSTKEVLRELKGEGATVSLLDPNEDGVVEPEVLKAAFTRDTVLVAFSHVHSELGSVAPIQEYSKLIRAQRKQGQSPYPLLHIDASQSLTVFSAAEIAPYADMLSADASKFYGVRGAGLLFVRDGSPIGPVLFGGGQERGLKPGTENIAAIAACAEALSICQEGVSEESERLRELSEIFVQRLAETVPEAKINSPEGAKRAPHIVDVCFPGKDAEFLVISLDAKGVYVSRGSACKESGPDISEAVLKTKGRACAESSLRFSLGRGSTEGDIEEVVEALSEI